MIHLELRFWPKIVMLLIALLFTAVIYAEEAKKDSVRSEVRISGIDEKRILGKIKTIYTMKGRPTQQRQASKGWHQVADSVKMVAGRAKVLLNTSTAQGRQDVSFISKVTYRGMAFNLDTLSTTTYKLTPLSGTKFLIKSSSIADISLVYFLVEGE